ncbi:MAG: hypothetical protein HY557_07010, partial [Euryarchaeota archaeon]|nr:hypothetical protein [Euryarchaeota archaeon]
MELPPGKLKRKLAGGKGVLDELLRELRTDAFNGFVRTSVYRGDAPADGVLVFQNGREILAGHRGPEPRNGSGAVPEIARDSLSDNGVIEVHSYDYKTSHISVPQLAETFPEARLPEVPDYASILAKVDREEAARREAHRREQEERRRKERELSEREEELFRRKWAIEQEHARSREQMKQLEAMKDELLRLRETSATVLQQFAESRERDGTLAAEQRAAIAEIERQRGEVEQRRLALEAREKDIAEKETTVAARDAALAAREEELRRLQETLASERSHLGDLSQNLASEAQKLASNRKAFDARVVEALRREAQVEASERKLAQWEEALKLREERV